MAKSLKLPNDYINTLIDSLYDFYGVEERDPDPNEPTEPSFMLSFYNIEPSSVYENIGFLFAMFWATQVAIYIALRINMRVGRL